MSVDIRLQSTGDKNVVVRAGKIPVRLGNLEVYGVLRMSFEALATSVPGFKAISVSFTDKPVIKFALAAVAHLPLYRCDLATWGAGRVDQCVQHRWHVSCCYVPFFFL